MDITGAGVSMNAIAREEQASIDLEVSEGRTYPNGNVDPRPRQEGSNLLRGNPDQRGGGPRPKLTADKLDEFLAQRDLWLAEAKVCLIDHNLRDAALCQKQANEIQSACITVGIGSKPKTVLGVEGTLDVCQSAYEESSDLPSFLKALEKGLKWD